MVFYGIDPGVAGGIACIDQAGEVLCAVKMPGTESDVFHVIQKPRGATPDEPRRAVLERVASSPQMGVVSAFTFGRGYGALRMALTVARIRFEEVSPVKWQNVLGCRTKGDKNVSKRKAQQLFPQIEITHAIADALLLAEYARRLVQSQGGEG
jgi:hypothetical protein